MTKPIILVNPTKEEMLSAKCSSLLEIVSSQEREIINLRYKNEKLLISLDWYRNLIEHARGTWVRSGAESAIKEIVLAEKEKK